MDKETILVAPTVAKVACTTNIKDMVCLLRLHMIMPRRLPQLVSDNLLFTDVTVLSLEVSETMVVPDLSRPNLPSHWEAVEPLVEFRTLLVVAPLTQARARTMARVASKALEMI